MAVECRRSFRESSLSDSLLARLAVLLILPSVAAGAQELRLGSEFVVNSFTLGDQDRPSVAMDIDGDFVVAWSSSGIGDRIFARRFSSAGAPLTNELQVNTLTIGQQFYPSVAAAANGDFVVVWYSYPDYLSDTGIRGRRFSSAGTALGDEFQVHTYLPGDQSDPSVAADMSGAFVVTWASNGQDGSGHGIFAQRFSSTGVRLGGEFRVNFHTPGSQSNPTVASDSDGDFVVAWMSDSQDASGYGIFAQRFSSAGTPLLGEFLVNLYYQGHQSNPAVALDSDGDFVVAWHGAGYAGEYEGIFVRRFSSAGVQLISPFQVNTYTHETQRDPSLAVDDAGDFTVVWRSYNQNGYTWGVFGRRFSSAGAALASEFQVSAYTERDQYYPSVAADADGDFVVAWHQDFGDGSGDGIVAQRFASPKILDIDANGQVGPLTDGLLVLRYLFGFTGVTLTTGAVGNGCTRCNAAAIEPYLQTLI